MHPKSMGTEASAVGTLLALIQCLPIKDRKNNVDGCSTASCSFGALAEGAPVLLLYHLEPIYVCILYNRAYPGSSADKKKNLPVMQETPVQFLGWEYPLEEG